MIKYCVKRPITVLMVVLIVVVLGFYSLTKLPLTLFPDVNLPYIVTVTTYEGASPLEVNEEVTSKIESAAQTIGNFKEIQSTSNEHFGLSIITFADGTNIDTVIIELRELINNISFKDGVGNTRIIRISPEMLPVVTVTLFQNFDEGLSDEEALIKNTEWINNEIMTELQSIPGVADVSVVGAAEVVLQINLDNTILSGYGLTSDAVLTTIEEQNIGGLVGVALDNGEIRMLYLGDKIANLDDIKSLPITKQGDVIIRLSDLTVADGIKFVNANPLTYSKINNKQGIQVSFQMQTNYSITEVSDNILNRLDEIAERDDASYVVILNQGEYINLAVDSVWQNLIIGGILAIAILLLFLRDLKPTLIVGLAIPISVIAAFMLMYFGKVSLNIVSMGGLALGIGMLVDNSIVVIENIYRMISEGRSRKEAAIYGAKQVAAAIASSTATTIAVFFPMIFIEGLISDVFMNMALTITFSLGASLIIALTLVPTMSSKMLKEKKEVNETKIGKKTKEVYKKIMNFNLKYKGLVIILVFVIFIVVGIGIISKGFVMLPETDEGNLSVSISTNSKVEFVSKAKLADKITEELMKLEDIETVSANIGGSGSYSSLMSLGSSDQISMNINLKASRKTKTSDYEEIIKDLIKEIDYDSIEGIDYSDLIDIEVNTQNSAVQFIGEQGIRIKVAGPSLEALEQIATDISGILSQQEDLHKISDGISRGQDNVKITINKDNAMAYGLTVADVERSISYFYAGLGNLISTNKVKIEIDNYEYEIEIPSSMVGNISYDVFGDYNQFLSGILLFNKDTLNLIDQYMSENPGGIYIPNTIIFPNQKLKFIVNPFLKVADEGIVLGGANPSLESLAAAPLFDGTDKSVAEVHYTTGFTSINTDGNSYYFTVSAAVAKNKNVTLVAREVNKVVEQYLNSDNFKQYGSGYQVTFEGENEEILSAVKDLALAGLVAILLVYMIMAIQFQSLLYPFIILITIPLAFTGGMVGLLIANMNLSIVSIMGLIILVGVVVNNGIVLVDYINHLIAEGKKVKDALIEAGLTRLRPILMTALTTIFGLVTMALGMGEGAELLQPMAVSTIGGLIYATFLTLTIVPTVYALFNHKRMKLEEEEN